jgi:hypothetical protein
VYQAQGPGRSVTLLGYVLDPYEPHATDADIVHRLLHHLELDRTRETFTRQTFAFGGRWIFVVDDGSDVWLFNDPCGFRQVFYSIGIPGGTWCASQTGILAETLGLAWDPDAADFIRAYRRREPEYTWPGDSSPYKELRHLLPNHYLDLNEGIPRRFWPSDAIPSRQEEEVATENAQLLVKIIESASTRAELALTVTAGKDTRLLLAACRAIRDRVYFNTWMYWDMDRKHRDIQVPSRLLARLGLPHAVIPCPTRMGRKFREVYRRNVPSGHEAIGVIAQGLYARFPRQRWLMMGDGIPVADWGLFFRSKLRLEKPKAGTDEIGPRTLGRLTNREEAFAIRAFDRWLSEARKTKADVLDLFGWEERESNFVGMTQAELDIAEDVLVPYDCRQFLVNMLSAPESSRRYPEFPLHKTMVLHLWPEVLAEPINPPVRPTLLSIGRMFLRKPGGRNWRQVWREFRRYAEAAKHGTGAVGRDHSA